MSSTILRIFSQYKILRGMASYSVLWPCGSLIQQTIEGKTWRTYDWSKCLRMCIFGSLVIGPSMYMWIRLANNMWPKRELKTSIAKALCEQISYDPFMIATFLFCMSLLEGKGDQQARLEVREKFFDTYKVGAVYWPCVQTINFTLVPPRNQVVVVSIFSMIWSSFLSYMKHMEIERIRQKKLEKKQKKLEKKRLAEKV
uniref:Putative conserved plasma membrane protein n=1 Tax=Nyssomyia neivai TaxID=330878 RepID=A0A1L8D8X5_9DIPT